MAAAQTKKTHSRLSQLFPLKAILLSGFIPCHVGATKCHGTDFNYPPAKLQPSLSSVSSHLPPALALPWICVRAGKGKSCQLLLLCPRSLSEPKIKTTSVSWLPINGLGSRNDTFVSELNIIWVPFCPCPRQPGVLQ